MSNASARPAHVGAGAPTRTTRAIADGFPRASRRSARGPAGPPVDTSTGRAAAPLNVGAYTYPTVITITGQTAVVVEPYGYTVELINLKTGRVSPPIAVGAFPTAVAITA